MLNSLAFLGAANVTKLCLSVGGNLCLAWTLFLMAEAEEELATSLVMALRDTTLWAAMERARLGACVNWILMEEQPRALVRLDASQISVEVVTSVWRRQCLLSILDFQVAATQSIY